MQELEGLELETVTKEGEIEVGEQEKKAIMNDIIKDARKKAKDFAHGDQTPQGRATKVTQWGEFYANRSRIKMENKTTSFGSAFTRIPPKEARHRAFGLIATAMNTLNGAQMLDQKVQSLTTLGAKLIQEQLLKECNNRYAYIVLHMLAEIYGAKVPNPDDFLSRPKTFQLKKIMGQINDMYNKRVA